jgi:hypothetical protein
VSRRGIQVLFVMIGVAWLLFTGCNLFIDTFGDCGSERLCTAYKNAAGGLLIWRGICIAAFIIIAYRLFRKEPDV